MNKKQTQCMKILSHLKRYNRITTMQAFTKYGITRLASRVWDLRSQGYEITTEYETKNGNTYGVYRLVK